MNYSTTHKTFSEILNEPEVLTDPCKFLGPNWRKVLEFWSYLDTLSFQDIAKINNSLTMSWWRKFFRFVKITITTSTLIPTNIDERTLETIIKLFGKYPSFINFVCATYELIALDLFYEKNQDLKFLPAFNFSY